MRALAVRAFLDFFSFFSSSPSASLAYGNQTYVIIYKSRSTRDRPAQVRSRSCRFRRADEHILHCLVGSFDYNNFLVALIYSIVHI